MGSCKRGGNQRLGVSSKSLLLVTPLQAGPWLFESPVSVTLTAIVSKFPDRSNVKNKCGSLFEVRVHVLGKSQQQEAEAAGRIAPTAEKQRNMKSAQSLFSFS